MINIAIDGPAGSGKTTVAKQISKMLDILYLDTGAMYRACGLYALNSGVSVDDEENVTKLMNSLDLAIEYKDGVQRTILFGKDVSEDIRKNEVSSLASKISVHKAVRLKMLEMQREIAKTNDCILDGRDIGSFVLPNAKYKFFLTASVKVRANRRYKELIAKGMDVDLEQLEKEIEERDLRDSTREIAPLKQAEDAIFIDTSDMTIEEVINAIVSKVKL